MRSRDKEKTTYLSFHEAYGTKLDKVEIYSKEPYSTESYDTLITWQTKKRYISTSMWPMTTKFDMIVTYDKKLQTTK